MSPKATGGSGVHYEAEVAACAMALLLSGHRGPLWNYPVIRVSLQQRAAGAQLDDMVLHLGADGVSQTVECQIKVTVTASVLREVAAAGVRMQWLHPSKFAVGQHRLGLITKAAPRAVALRELARLAELTSLEGFLAQLVPVQSAEPVRREWNLLRQMTGPDSDDVTHRLLSRLDVWQVNRDGRGPDIDYVRILDTVARNAGTRPEQLFLCLKDIAAKIAETGGDIDAGLLRRRLARDYGIAVPEVPPMTAADASIVRFLPTIPLAGRQAELGLLARHCTSDQHAYLCWRGPAWAGKTALLAWFARHPPAGVRVLASFVSARSGVRDRVSFVDDQLAALTEQFGFVADTSRPPGLRDGVLIAQWAQAAAACVAQGSRLAVIIDGLDEDTAARFEASIAGLLPYRLPDGLCFVVSIRDRRPLPGDVDDDHPLRAAAWTDLAASPSARTVRTQALAELTRLWRDRPVGRNVLGFVAAAQGGLTRHDLAGLCEEDLGTIDDLISSATARAIGQDPDGGHVLIHESLHDAVTELFGPLDAYHARIDAWADEYQVAGWPANTPHYLLHGYPLARKNSPERLLALATDIRRRDRLLSDTGADAAALREIRLAESAHRVAESPDLGALLHLALHRQRLTRQTRVVPDGLPAVIAAVEGWDRAVHLATSIGIESMRDAALVELVEAARTAAQCLDLVDRIGSPTVRALAQIRALPLLGELPADFSVTITKPVDRARVLALAAQAFGPDRATGPWWEKLVHDCLRAARAIGDDQRGRALAWLAELPGADVDALLAEAMDIVGSSDSIMASIALRMIAASYARAGEVDRAIALAASVARPYDQWALCDVVSGLAHADAGTAERLAGTISGPAARACALAAVSRAHAAAGRRSEALRLAGAGCELLADGGDARFWQGTHTTVAAALAAAGDLDRAAAAARTADWYLEIAAALTAVAAAAVQHGELAIAAELAREAHQVTRTDGYDEGLVEVRDQLSRYRPAEPTPDPVLTQINDLLDDGRIEAAEQFARHLDRGPLRDEAFTELSSAVAVEGDPRRAESMLDEIDDPRQQSEALMWLARHAKPAEYPERLPALAGMAYDRLRSPTDAETRTNLICTIAEHDPEQAADLARHAFDDDEALAYALAAIAYAARNKSLARRLLAEALQLDRFEPAISIIAMMEPAALQAAAADSTEV